MHKTQRSNFSGEAVSRVVYIAKRFALFAWSIIACDSDVHVYSFITSLTHQLGVQQWTVEVPWTTIGKTGVIHNALDCSTARSAAVSAATSLSGVHRHLPLTWFHLNSICYIGLHGLTVYVSAVFRQHFQ